MATTGVAACAGETGVAGGGKDKAEARGRVECSKEGTWGGVALLTLLSCCKLL